MTTPRDAMVLERRPRAESLTVEELVRETLAGRVRISRFLRRVRWDADDVERLLDSIYRGYPIGNLLIWAQPGDAELLEYGSVRVDAPPQQGCWWVVDGQQRLQALVRSLAGAGPSAEPFALYFDLVARALVRPEPGAELPEHWLPLTEALDVARLLAWLREHPGVDRELALTFAKQIREYAVPAWILTTDDLDTVEEIFMRTKVRGKPMEPEEVFSALRSELRAQPPSELREVGERLAEFEFGRFEPRLLRAMASAMLDAEDEAVEITERTAAELERSARAVVVFLREAAKVPHLSLLPDEQSLLVLTRVFHCFPRTHPRNRELLARWFWRRALLDTQDPAASGRLARAAIDPHDEHGSVQALLRLVSTRSEGSPSVSNDALRLDGARDPLLTLALWSLEPRNLQTGERLAFSNDASELLPLARISDELPADALGSRLIHPPLAGLTLRDAILASSDARALASHALDDETLGALEARDFERFLALREDRLRALVERFYRVRTRWEQSDRPPLSALLIDIDEPEPAQHGH